MALAARFVPRSLLNPISRLALATFVWNHRHEVLRWGRTLVEQLQTDVSPARTARTARVLFAIASEPTFRNAKQLRKVTMDGGVVDLDVDERWRQLARLIEHVEAVGGVEQVLVNGRPAGPGLRVVRADAARN